MIVNHMLSVVFFCLVGIAVAKEEEARQFSYSAYDNSNDYDPGYYQQPEKDNAIDRMAAMAVNEFQERQDTGDYDYKDPYLEDTAAFIAVTTIALYVTGLAVLVVTVLYTSAVATATNRKKRDLEVNEEDSSWVSILEDIAGCTTKYLCEVDKDLEKKRRLSQFDTESKRKGKALLLHRCDELKAECPVDVGFILNIVRLLSVYTENQKLL